MYREFEKHLRSSKNSTVGPIVVVVVALILISCEKKPVDSGGDEAGRTYSVQVYAGGVKQSSAIVSMRLGSYYYSSKFDDQKGCVLEIPNTSAPSELIVVVSGANLIPTAFTVPGAINTDYSGSIELHSRNEVSMLASWEPYMVCLGDGNYSQETASLYQAFEPGGLKNLSIGMDFSISSIPPTMPAIRFLARGVQTEMHVFINGHAVAQVAPPQSEGMLAEWNFALHGSPSEVLKSGKNELVLRTGDLGSNNKDDVDLAAVSLYLVK